MTTPTESVATGHTRTDVRRANTTWETLMRTHAVMTAHFAADHIWAPVTMSEYDILYSLDKAGCSMRATDLAREVYLSQPTLSRTVDRLVERGFIDKAPAPRDGRATLLTLTPAGRSARAEVGRKHALAITKRVGGVLSPDDLDTLTTLLTRILEANPR